MTEHPEQRAARVRKWANDRERCRVCGLLRINVVHEPDPQNAPEGPYYYETFPDSLQTFVQSGDYEKAAVRP